MAFKILTSLWGKRAGISKEGFLVDKFSRAAVMTDYYAPTTGETLNNRGISVIESTTTAPTYTMPTPAVGYVAKIVSNSSSTLTNIVTSATTIFFGVQGSNTTLTFPAVEAAVILEGISATRWAILSNVGTVAGS